MAIDLRQEQQQQRQQQPRRPATPPRPRGTVWVVMAVAAVVAVGAGITALTLQDQPAPAGGVTVSYPEGAFTAEREGGVYVVVPEPVADFTDTAVGVREGGPYGLNTDFNDTAVGVREGGSYASTT
jgi:hypothetical protein